MFQLSALPWKSKSPPVTLDGDEQLVDSFSTHWIKYAVPLLLYVLMIGLAISLLFFAQSRLQEAVIIAHSSFLVAIFFLTWIHHWFFHRILSEAMVDVIITNKRLIYLEDSLWFFDNMHEVTLERLKAVEANKKGIIQNLFHYGTLWFDTGGSDEDSSIIPLVPYPHSKAKQIVQILKFK